MFKVIFPKNFNKSFLSGILVYFNLKHYILYQSFYEITYLSSKKSIKNTNLEGKNIVIFSKKEVLLRELDEINIQDYVLQKYDRLNRNLILILDFDKNEDFDLKNKQKILETFAGQLILKLTVEPNISKK